MAIGEAAAGHALITGGSGVAMGLPENFRRAGLLPERDDPARAAGGRGPAAVLAGSCSRATLVQIAHRARACAGAASSIRSPRRTPRRWPRRRCDWMADKLGAHAGRDRRLRPAGQGGGVAAEAGARRRRRADRAGDGARSPRAWWRAACAAWWWRAARPPARWCAARRAQPAHRRGDRSRRALDLCRGRRRAAAAGAEIGQFRRPRLLPQGLRGAGAR